MCLSRFNDAVKHGAGFRTPGVYWRTGNFCDQSQKAWLNARRVFCQAQGGRLRETLPAFHAG